jgi:hypothetical protein
LCSTATPLRNQHAFRLSSAFRTAGRHLSAKGDGAAAVQVKADEYCELLRDAMMANTFVRELKLANCDIKCRGAAALGELLAANHTLQVHIHPSICLYSFAYASLEPDESGLAFQVGLCARADPSGRYEC